MDRLKDIANEIYWFNKELASGIARIIRGKIFGKFDFVPFSLRVGRSCIKPSPRSISGIF